MPIHPDRDLFCSTYRHDYIYFYDGQRPAIPYNADTHRLSPKQLAKFNVEIPEARKLLEGAASGDQEVDYDKEMALLDKYRMQTVYRRAFQGLQGYEWRTDFGDMLDPECDELILTAKRIYEEHPKTIPRPPLPTSRRVFPFSPLKDYLTGTTVYQETFGRVGYERLCKEAEKGGVRLGPKYNHEKGLAIVNRIINREDTTTEKIDPKDFLYEFPCKLKPKQKYEENKEKPVQISEEEKRKTTKKQTEKDHVINACVGGPGSREDDTKNKKTRKGETKSAPVII